MYTIGRPVRATVITDASYCPQTGAAGWAAWVKVDGLTQKIADAGNMSKQPENSTVAELMAAVNGIWLAARAGATHILLQSDCMAVIHIVQGSTKSRTLLDIWEPIMALPIMQGRFITAKHVKGHTATKDARSWVNGWCDREAGKYMEKERGHRRSKTGKAAGQNRSSKPKGNRTLASWGVCPRP